MKSAVKFDVQEYDTTLTDTTNLPCVVGTRGGGLVPCKFDAVVAVIPAPAVGGAAHQRSIYTGGLLPFDPGSMGPERWSGFVGGALRAASDLVDDEGIIYMLVPTGVREGTGYTSRPELLHVVLELARKVGLKVLEKLRIVEVEPVKQPFVGCNRPERWSIRFARSVAAGGVGP
jgi:hypothetical protein